MSRYKKGQWVKIVRLDNNACLWKVGDVGRVELFDQMVENNHGVLQLCSIGVRMETKRNGLSMSYGEDDNYVPITRPGLWERIRRKFRRPHVDLTPGSWDGIGWHPDKLKEKEHEEA